MHSLVDGTASGVAFFGGVPVGDGGFAHLPTEQNDLAAEFAGKVEQADVEVLYLHADGIDL